MKLPLRRPRYADIAATLALFLAMGGTAYAVTQIDPNSVNTAAIQDKAVTQPKLHSNSVNSSKIVDGSIASVDLADGSIGNSQLAPGAVTGDKVANKSISLANLVGADVSGGISFSLGANACGNLTLGVSAAQVGQVVLISYTGTVALPPAVVMGLARVSSAGTITLRACNVSSSSVTVSNIGVRIITFG